MNQDLVITVNYRKSSYLSNYLKNHFCQAGFNFFSIQNSFFYCFIFCSSQGSLLIKHIVLIFSLENIVILNLKNANNLKNSEGLMPIAWHSRRCWSCCMSKKKQNRLLLSNDFYATREYQNILTLEIFCEYLVIFTQFNFFSCLIFFGQISQNICLKMFKPI